MGRQNGRPVNVMWPQTQLVVIKIGGVTPKVAPEYEATGPRRKHTISSVVLHQEERMRHGVVVLSLWMTRQKNPAGGVCV